MCMSSTCLRGIYSREDQGAWEGQLHSESFHHPTAAAAASIFSQQNSAAGSLRPFCRFRERGRGQEAQMFFLSGFASGNQKSAEQAGHARGLGFQRINTLASWVKHGVLTKEPDWHQGK